jgi:hypothetical protein
VTSESSDGGSDGGPDGGEAEPDIAALGHQKDELVDENEVLHQKLAASKQASAKPKERRGRTVGSWVLVVLACLLAITSVVVVYARNELLNDNTFVATLAPLASIPAVQTAVATRVSDSLVAQTNIEQRVKNALPARAGFLANPITSTVKSTSYNITLKLVKSSQFQHLWEQALRDTHKQLDNLLTGSNRGPFSAANGQVTVDLSKVQTAAKQQLASHGISVFEKVPQYKGVPLVLFESKQLLKLQRLVKVLNSLAFILPTLALLLFALSVVLSRDRRKGLVHAATGLAVSMALLLIVANIGRNQYLASLLPGQSKRAMAAVIDTVDAVLLDSVRTILIVAAVVATVAFLLGTGPVKRWFVDRKQPNWMTSGPVHSSVAAHRRAFQWGVLALGLVVLVVWNQPTAKVAINVVLFTFLLVILVGLYGRGDPDGGPPTLDARSGPDNELVSGAAGA